ncbi:MAG: BTAD domain-containing putative transcriptional regulator [Dermatophilaceae bacterium]
MEFAVLGPVTVTHEGTPIPLRLKELHLVACLLVDPGAEVSQSRLLDELWGETGPARLNSLRVHISRLRSALRSADGAPSRLATTPRGYALALAPGELDLARVHAGLALARERRARDPVGAHEILRGALAEWRGEPFGGLDSPSVQAQRDLCDVLRQEIVTEFADLASRHHPCPDLEVLSRLHAESPTNETVACALARGQARRGDSVAALASIRDFRRRMVRDWGLDVGPDVAGLERAILAGDRATQPAPHRATTVALAPQATPVRGFPAERERLIRDVLAIVASRPGARVGVSGGRGMGRTHLVRAICDCLDGARLVTGSPDRPYAAVRDLLSASGIPTDEVDSVLAESHSGLAGESPVATRLREVLDGIPLLVIDDADLVDADSAALLREVLGDAPVPVVATALTPAGFGVLAGDSPDRADDLVVVTLSPLTLAGVRLLLSSAGLDETMVDRWAERVAASSAGQPFIAAALARQVARRRRDSALPSSLGRFAADLRTSLDGPDRRVLDFAVLDHPRLDLAILGGATCLGADRVVEAVERLLALGLLTLEPRSGHAEVHSGWLPALTAALGPIERQALHARLAEATSEREGVHPSDVVRHLRAAGPQASSSQLARWLMEDARAALAAYGVLSAIAAFTEAVQAADAADDQTLATQARLGLVEALHHAGRAGEAQLVVREAVRGARRGNDPDAFGRAVVYAATPLVPDDELRGEVSRDCDEAAEWLADVGGDPSLRAQVLEAAIRSRVLDLGAAGRVLAYADDLRRHGASVPPTHPDQGIVALGLRYAAFVAGVPARERLAYAEAAVRRTRGTYGSGRHLAAVRVRAVDQMFLDPGGAGPAIEGYARTARDCGAAHHVWLAGRMAASAALADGDWERYGAERDRVREEESGIDPGLVRMGETVQQCVALMHRRDWSTLLAALDAEVSVSEAFAPLVDATRCFAADRLGRPLPDSVVRDVGARLSTHGTHLAGHALLAGLRAASPRVVRRSRERLARHTDEWVVIEGGLGVLGPVSAFLSPDRTELRTR